MFSMTTTKSSRYYRCFYITRAGLNITLAQLDLRDSITDLIPTLVSRTQICDFSKTDIVTINED
jgi:hypothetical protein